MDQRLLPMITVFIAVVVAVQPWGLSSAGRLAIGLSPGLVIFYWSARRDRKLSAVSVAIMGLLFDVVSGGDIGYCALVFLIALGVSVWLYGGPRRQTGFPVMAFAGVVVAMVLTIGALSHFVSGYGMSVWTALYGASYAVLAFVPVYLVLKAIEGPSARGGNRFGRLT